jgi:hypothetical protein
MKNAVFWDVMPCGSCKDRTLWGTYRLHHQGEKKRRFSEEPRIVTSQKTAFFAVIWFCTLREKFWLGKDVQGKSSLSLKHCPFVPHELPNESEESTIILQIVQVWNRTPDSLNKGINSDCSVVTYDLTSFRDVREVSASEAGCGVNWYHVTTEMIGVLLGRRPIRSRTKHIDVLCLQILIILVIFLAS